MMGTGCIAQGVCEWVVMFVNVSRDAKFSSG